MPNRNWIRVLDPPTSRLGSQFFRSSAQLLLLLQLFSLETIRVRDVGEIHVASNSLVAARIEVYAYAFTTLGYSLSLSLARFDPGRSQNDYNNYFIRRGSGPLCLPILKVITRCLHCPSGTALRGHASPSQPHGYTVTMLHHESPLYVYASACPLCTLALPSSVVARSTFANGFVALLLHEQHIVLEKLFFSFYILNQ